MYELFSNLYYLFIHECAKRIFIDNFHKISKTPLDFKKYFKITLVDVSN